MQKLSQEIAVEQQLEDLHTLNPGWFDGDQGKAPAASVLKWLSDFFSVCYPGSVPEPRLYPTPEGGVQVEWQINTTEISLYVQCASLGKWHSLDMSTGHVTERVLNLKDTTVFNWLVKTLRQINQNR